MRVNGDLENRLPNTTSIAFEFVEGEAILLLLNEEGICASSGSACTSGSLEPSHVLRAMGVPFTAAHGSVRLSLSVYNTQAEVDKVIAVLPGIIARLREMSPFWPEQACKVTAYSAGALVWLHGGPRGRCVETCFRRLRGDTCVHTVKCLRPVEHRSSVGSVGFLLWPVA